MYRLFIQHRRLAWFILSDPVKIPGSARTCGSFAVAADGGAALVKNLPSVVLVVEMFQRCGNWIIFKGLQAIAGYHQ